MTVTDLLRLQELSSREEVNQFAAECLQAWKQERDPTVAFCIASLVQLYPDELDPALFSSYGMRIDSVAFESLAFERFKELATTGSAHATRWVALYYQAGFHPVTRDPIEHLRWLKKAAELGDRLSAAELRHLQESTHNDAPVRQ